MSIILDGHAGHEPADVGAAIAEIQEEIAAVAEGPEEVGLGLCVGGYVPLVYRNHFKR